jgi:hypothetical protein
MSKRSGLIFCSLRVPMTRKQKARSFAYQNVNFYQDMLGSSTKDLRWRWPVANRIQVDALSVSALALLLGLYCTYSLDVCAILSHRAAAAAADVT